MPLQSKSNTGWGVKMFKKKMYFIGLLISAIGFSAAPEGLQAHKPVTSKYTYYQQIQPLFQFYCGGCHVSEGIAPMSLMTYKEAYPWAESIKEQLLADSMHPWHDDESFGVFTHSQRMTPRQLDMIVDWTSGGTPEGTQNGRAYPPMNAPEWTLGTPDLLLPMPTSVQVEADIGDKTVDIILPTGLTEDQWLTAMDLKPGYPGMVHNAILYLAKGTSETMGPETEMDIPADQILGVWIPGQMGTIAEESAYRLPADAQLTLRIHYRKTWRDEGVVRSDQSTLGLYFAPRAPTKTIRTLVLQKTQEIQAKTDIIRLEQTFSRDITLNGIMPVMTSTGRSVRIEVKTPDSEEIDLLRIAIYDQGWPIRYDFHEPVYVPRGSRIIITGTFGTDGRERADAEEVSHSMKVWLDYIL
jgi:hypothetical protein